MQLLAQAIPHQVELARWIPLCPIVAMVICGLLGAFKPLRGLAALVTIIGTAAAATLSFMVFQGMGGVEAQGAYVVKAFDWVVIGGFSANMSFYIDPLTAIMLLVVNGIGTLIAIYASGYMKGDSGYFRFFAYIALFILAMNMLVLADNLLLLYLGWEGVGLASFLLIGYYYRKPSAIAAAKKAFIVNRVGDLGFALGLMMLFMVFGTIHYSEFIPAAKALASHQTLATDAFNNAAAHFTNGDLGTGSWMVLIIPFLLMLGAFGKSAQLPLHVWLPDAMEGPTPVSALIHAATMVTAGVYMISRLISVFALNPCSLTVVAIVGGVTALFAATIALCQYDIKRIWAYSTVSQLGFMFMGVGVMATYGAVFHLVTHAFFKALLFLTAGSVMHALAGQLDLRKMSGLWKKMPWTAFLMLIGCIALAGVPPFAGFYSKDNILTEVLAFDHGRLAWLGWMGIATAMLTAFYTFRLWFRVFMGPTQYTMGNEHHGYEVEHGHGHDDHGHAAGHGDDHGHHGPHEMPWIMNLPLFVLAAGAVAGGFLLKDHILNLINASSAATASFMHAHDEAAHARLHTMVGIISGGGACVMILLAAVFHWFGRPLADKANAMFAPVVKVLNNKYYIDELYQLIIVLPLRLVAYVCDLFDRLIIDGIVDGVGKLTQAVGRTQRPMQRGLLQGLAATMAVGVMLTLVILVYLMAPKKQAQPRAAEQSVKPAARLVTELGAK